MRSQCDNPISYWLSFFFSWLSVAFCFTCYIFVLFDGGSSRGRSGFPLESKSALAMSLKPCKLENSELPWSSLSSCDPGIESEGVLLRLPNNEHTNSTSVAFLFQWPHFVTFHLVLKRNILVTIPTTPGPRCQWVDSTTHRTHNTIQLIRATTINLFYDSN